MGKAAIGNRHRPTFPCGLDVRTRISPTDGGFPYSDERTAASRKNKDVNCPEIPPRNHGMVTDEDEELLVLFASQAAAAIANARTYRAEQRARADLEALVETSPFGVLVFHVPTGHPVSVNREARRLMEDLRSPGESDEQVMQVLTCRFADGREIALDRIPLGSVLSDAQTVRAEEVVLSTPDGRSVTVLVNVTPIHTSDGTVESIVGDIRSHSMAPTPPEPEAAKLRAHRWRTIRE